MTYLGTIQTELRYPQNISTGELPLSAQSEKNVGKNPTTYQRCFIFIFI